MNGDVENIIQRNTKNSPKHYPQLPPAEPPTQMLKSCGNFLSQSFSPLPSIALSPKSIDD